MSIHQRITINSSPEKIYQALTNQNEFSEITDAPASFETGEGGAFSAFGGQITGRNLELDKNRMIAQAWRVGAWPPGCYSVVRFTLDQDDDKTVVVLDHSGYPEDAEEHLEGGWHKMYWEPLARYFS